MIRILRKVGNSHNITIDRTMMEQMGVHEGSRLSMHLDGRNLVLTPVDDRIEDAVFDRTLEDGMNKYADALRRLS